MSTTSLKDTLTASDRHDAVVSDLAQLADQQISGMSGLSGMAVKGAYGAAKKARADIAEVGARHLLPQLADALQPYWEAYVNGQPAGGFGQYLETRSDEVSRDLLSVADDAAGKLDQPAIAKVYKGVRSKGEKLVAQALRPLGEVIEKHAK